jgi:hypothetical protein
LDGIGTRASPLPFEPVEECVQARPGAADPGCAVGEQQMVEFAFAQVLVEGLAQAALDASGSSPM